MTGVPVIDVTQYQRIVLLTGAGISVASGLPTYRGAGGLWKKVDVEQHATAAAIEADPARVWEFFSEVRALLATARPNAAHLIIANVASRLRKDQQMTVLTQNVDGLHGIAGSNRVVELHGTLRRSRCTRCSYSRSEDLATVPMKCPTCPDCGAFMRPDVVLFDESLPVDAEWESKKALRDCDLFLAVGTSGTVSPASNFVRAAEYAGARTVYVNMEPMKPANPAFHESYFGRAEESLPALLGNRDPSGDDRRTLSTLSAMLNSSEQDQLTHVLSYRALPARIVQSTPALFVDVDGLIWLNDQAGHLAGDEALVQIAAALSQTFPSNVFRVGGDEFLVQLGTGSSAEALRKGEAVVNVVRELNIEYRRIDRPDRERLEVNVVAFTLEPEMVRKDFSGNGVGHELRDTLAELIYSTKVQTGRGYGLVVDALALLPAPVSL